MTKSIIGKEIIMKRITVILLISAMLAATACGDTSTPANTDVTDTTETTESLPEYDFGGREYRILCRTDKDYEFNVTSETGDIVDDAVFARNRKINEEYNVSITPIMVDGDWNSNAIFTGAIASSVLSGSDDYDLIAGYNAYITSLITQGYLTDLNELVIDFSQPWWYSGFNDNIEIAGKKFFCLGDASLTMWENLEVVFFNKQMIEDYGAKSPYEHVKEDSWTFDQLREYCLLVSDDINGDSVMDENDKWGMIFYNVRSLAPYFEINYCTTGEDGYPQISLYNEKTVDAYDKMFDFLCVSNAAKQFVPDIDQKIFTEDRAMFFQGPLRYAELFRDNTSDFGIVPFPKHSAEQDRYYTTVVDDLSVFCIPTNAPDMDFCGVMLDALCRESSELVIPQYYEKALKVKYSRDDDSVEMLNLIRDSIWFDFGFVYSISLNYLGTFFDILMLENPDISSAWAANEPAYNEALNKLLDYFRETGETTQTE